MSQAEILELIKAYNSTDRTTIKANLKRLMAEYSIKPGDIMSLGYAKNHVYGWTTKSNPNIPLFEQALNIATKFNFDVKELLINS